MHQWELHKKHSFRSKREASRVCYEDVGCFEDAGPFSYLEMLPSPPKDVGTRFFVYQSRKPRSISTEVPADDINERVSNAIDPELPTKVIVHGFGSDCEHIWVYEMRSALMSVHDCNIVCVDWSPGSAIPNYVRAAANTRLVGRQLAKLIKSLNVSLDTVHMIGFSLGAHVAGFAGAELANVSRITGLDPAGPLFESQDPRARLDATDANFVDVIHSNGEQLLLGGLGSWQPMGDVDFYPNGGRMQTGCSNLFVGAVSDFIWSGSTVEGRSLCNHRRAYKFFTDSVSPKCRFPAFPCEKGYDGLLQGECFPCSSERPCGDMGYYSDTSDARGQLYLITREEEPFCSYQYQIKVFNSRGERPARSYGKLQVTLVGSDSFNETFTMTRKDDEELLVGSVLHKIVVPHPVIVNLEAIEVKYTAYSGWISSGLVSWSIDKVSILDSFGNSHSVCRRELILESGRPVYLPLYPGECNIPVESENSTSVNTSLPLATTKTESLEKASNAETTSSNIGPFTKEHNFERNERYTAEFISTESNNPRRNFGPFIKSQNLQLNPNDNRNSYSFEKDNKKVIIYPWFIDDLNDTGSNSVETSEIESGRGFSGAEYIISTSTSSATSVDSTTTIEFTSEIQEPVLQVTKYETGRSMRLPEITEPILRPRTTRQNEKEVQGKAINQELTERPSTKEEDKGFTVQFLPERLVGFLAQAEKYAKETFLPLISQYTPSFVGGRQERLKYFPPLTDIATEGSSTIDDNFSLASTTNKNNQQEVLDVEEVKNSSRSEKQIHFNSFSNSSPGFARLELIESLGNSTESENLTIKSQSEWIPIDNKQSSTSASDLESYNTFKPTRNDENTWMNQEDNIDRPRNFDTLSRINSENDWVPIIEQTKINSFDVDSSTKEVFTTTETIEASKLAVTNREVDKRIIPHSDNSEAHETFTAPLVANDNKETTSTETTPGDNSSHIQRIPNNRESKRNEENKSSSRSTIFPYAYERNKDPRSRYIPLIPEEEMGRFPTFYKDDQ
ncbi:uncharacterized protein [Chelonus insularis]|nr:uncharacterized protein LOC118071211 isoform X2 [Chelonus insularis]